MKHRTMSLGEILKVQSGFAFRSELFCDKDRGIPLIRIRDLPNQSTEVNYDGDYREEFLVDAGDFLIGMDGDFRCFRWAGHRGLLNQRVCRLYGFSDALDPEYVFHWIGRKLDEIHETTAFVTVKHISAKQILGLTINLPPISEQRRIVDILNHAASIKRLCEEAHSKAQQVIPALFVEIFGDPATNPKGWKVVSFFDVLSTPVKNGLYLPKDRYVNRLDTGIEMMHMADAFYGSVKRGKLRRVIADEKQIADYALCERDLIIARRSLNFDGAAKACKIPRSKDPLIFESSLIRVTPNPDIVTTELLYYHLNDPNYRTMHVYKRITGATIFGINQAGLSELPIFVPPIDLQEKFIERVAELEGINELNERATIAAEKLSQSLMSEVFG